MALVKCPECGKEISDKATVCINCGYPVSEHIEQQKTEDDHCDDSVSYQSKNDRSEQKTFSSEIRKTNYVEEGRPIWKRWWFLLLMCIFAPPVGLCLLWISKKPKYTLVRIIITVFLAIYSIVWCAALFGESDSAEEQSISDQVVLENSVDENATFDIAHEDQGVVEESEPESIDEEAAVSSEQETSGTEDSGVEEVVSETEDEYKATCTEYNYKDVLRNPDEYVGKRVKITVKVSSVHDKGLFNPVKYYFAYTNDEYDMWLGDQYGVFDYREAEDPKILDDDVIIIYGEISEPQETQSLIVNSQEIFCIDMKYVELISE